MVCTPNKVKNNNNNDLKSPPQEIITLSTHCLSIWSLRGAPHLKKPKCGVVIHIKVPRIWGEAPFSMGGAPCPLPS